MQRLNVLRLFHKPDRFQKTCKQSSTITLKPSLKPKPLLGRENRIWLKLNSCSIQFAKCLLIFAFSSPARVCGCSTRSMKGQLPTSWTFSFTWTLSEKEKSLQGKPLLLQALEVPSTPSKTHSDKLRSAEVHVICSWLWARSLPPQHWGLLPGLGVSFAARLPWPSWTGLEPAAGPGDGRAVADPGRCPQPSPVHLAGAAGWGWLGGRHHTALVAMKPCTSPGESDDINKLDTHKT